MADTKTKRTNASKADGLEAYIANARREVEAEQLHRTFKAG